MIGSFCRTARALALVTALALGLGTSSVFADGYTLPSVAINMPEVLAAVGTYIGGIVIVCVGLAAAFHGVRMGVRWMRGMVR